MGPSLDVLFGDGVNGTPDFFWRSATAGGDDLATNVFGDSGSSVKRKKKGGLELGFGAFNLCRSDRDGKTVPLLQSEMDKVIEVGDVF